MYISHGEMHTDLRSSSQVRNHPLHPLFPQVGMPDACLMHAGFLSTQQKQDFQDCFALLDTDKMGRLSVDNLTSAFQLLNIAVLTPDPNSCSCCIASCCIAT